MLVAQIRVAHCTPKSHPCPKCGKRGRRKRVLHRRIRSLAYRQEAYVDVSYAEITANPMAAIERVYAAAGITLTAEARAAMLEWEARNPQGKSGEHRYSVEQAGFSENEIRAAYAEYMERFKAFL